MTRSADGVDRNAGRVEEGIEVRSGLARSTALMTAGTVISRVTGVLRLAVLAATLGVTETRFTDTYNLANMAPNILYELVLGGVITAVFVPVFVELLHKDDPDAAWRDLSGIVNWSLLGLTALALVGMVAAPWIAEFYASRLEGDLAEDQQRVITFLLRLFIPQVVFYGIYFMGSGLLNAHKRFALPMFTPIANNIVLIVVLIVFHRAYGLVEIDSVTTPQLLLLGLGTTASVMPMGLLLLPSIRRLGGYRFTLSVDPALVKKLVRLSAYITGTVAANQLGYLVVQWLANARQGGYTAYLSAFAFFLLPIGLFVWSLTTALAPTLSRNALLADWDAFKADLSTGLRATIFLTLPATAGFLLLSDPLVEAFLRHGVVTADSTDLIVDVLTFLVLGLVQFSLFQVLTRAFYAMQNGRTPFLVNCLVIGVNVAINIPMYWWLGIKGLAAGHAIAYTLGVFFLTRALSQRVGELDLALLGRSFLRMAAATVGMSGVVWATDRAVGAWLGSSGTIAPVVSLLLATTIGGVSYLVVAGLLKVEELDYVRNVLARRRAEAQPPV